MKKNQPRHIGHTSSYAQAGTSGLISRQIGCMNWTVSSRYAARLFSSEACQWDQLENDPHALLVKSNPLRRVYRLTIQDEDYYVKVYSAVNFFHSLKWLLRRDPARREFQNITLARAHSVSVPEPIAWTCARLHGRRQAFLVTKSLGPAQSLEDMIHSKGCLPDEILPLSLKAAGRLIAQLHRAGLYHPDLHPGNILLPVSSDSLKNPCAWLVDLQNIRVKNQLAAGLKGPFLTWRMTNVAMLLGDIYFRLGEKYLPHFAREYLSVLYDSPNRAESEVTGYIQHLIPAIIRYRRLLCRRRMRRAVRNSRYAGKINLPDHWRGHVFFQHKHSVDFAPASTLVVSRQVWEKALHDPKTLLEDGRILKDEQTATIISKDIIFDKADSSETSVPIPIVVKHYPMQQGWQGILSALWPSRTRHAWRQAWALVTMHLPTAWPLAALIRKQGPFMRESISVTENIPQSINLMRLVRDGSITQSYPARKELACKLGTLLAKLRYYGFSHRDCKGTNIIVQCSSEYMPSPPDIPDPSVKAIQCYLVDLDGLSLPRIKSTDSPYRELIRLGASMKNLPQVRLYDFARTFRSYIQYLDLPEAHDRIRRRRLWYALRKQIAFKAAHSAPQKLFKKNFHNILIVKPSSLGDVVRCLPVLYFLRDRYPHARISWLIQPRFADLLKALLPPAPEKHYSYNQASSAGILDEIIEFDRHHFARIGRSWRVTRDFLQFMSLLRQKQFDLVLDLQGLFRSAIFSWITGAPTRLGFDRARELAPYFYTHLITMPEHTEHIVQSYLRFCRALTPEGDDSFADRDINFNVPIDPFAQRSARRLVHQAGLTSSAKRYIVVLPGGTRDAKRWAPENFAQMALKLYQDHHLLSVILGAGTAEAEITEQIIRHARTLWDDLPPNALINLVNQTTLAEMTAIIKESALTIGNDSGPLHIAAALNIPTLGLYGPTDPKVVGPYGHLENVIHPNPDIPHTRRYSLDPEHQMTNISVDEVLEKVQKKL
ncbi:MAG: hypothetical protein JW860_05360 [Sedimentisphaerales bacterium]|nr:hypothetical protein [Sedimentisphaerales bacterium]